MTDNPNADFIHRLRSIADLMSKGIPDGYALVYQGGHHSVYCNGKTHIRITGGYATSQPIREYAGGRPACDCKTWRHGTNQHEAA
jgi:hypothetical protein